MKTVIVSLILLLVFSSESFAKTIKEYFPDGRLYSVQKYDAQGNIVGPYKVYWQNGRLREKTLYRYGQPHKTIKWSFEGVRQ
jgi:antitoxin component YwqK of YwqJK toxin-antitoxin module